MFGLVGPRNGNYSVLLDSVKVCLLHFNLNARSDIPEAQTSFSGQVATTQQASLFSQGNLSASRIHQLIITNEIEGHLLIIDLFNITQSYVLLKRHQDAVYRHALLMQRVDGNSDLELTHWYFTWDNCSYRISSSILRYHSGWVPRLLAASTTETTHIQLATTASRRTSEATDASYSATK